MIAANSLSDALPLVAALAEELAFALISDLKDEKYRRPNPALDHASRPEARLLQSIS